MIPDVIATMVIDLAQRCRIRQRGRRVHWPKGTKLSDIMALYDMMEARE